MHRLQRGQGLSEYALLIVLVAMVIMVMLIIFGEGLKDVYQFIVDSLPFSI